MGSSVDVYTILHLWIIFRVKIGALTTPPEKLVFSGVFLLPSVRLLPVRPSSSGGICEG